MEHRHFTRVSFHSDAHIGNSQQRYPTTVLDLSLQGALIKKPENWSTPADGPLYLTIHLNEHAVEVTMQVTVAHEHQNVIGLHCVEIDIDSVSHLRRLLELNLGNADLLSRDLSELSAAVSE